MTEFQECVRSIRRFTLVATLAACGGGDSKTEAAAEDTSLSEGPASEAAGAAILPGEAGPITLSAADFDAFEKGIARETQLVRAASERAVNAATPQERGEAIQAGFEQKTMAAAAPATGLSVERYKLVRETLSSLLTTLDMQGKIAGPQSVDSSRADPTTIARLQSDPYSALDSASAAELKSRMSRIVPLWIAYVNLTALNS